MGEGDHQVTARELLEAAESILSAGTVCDGPRFDLAGKIRRHLAEDDFCKHCLRCHTCSGALSRADLCLRGQELRRAIQ